MGGGTHKRIMSYVDADSAAVCGGKGGLSVDLITQRGGRGASPVNPVQRVIRHLGPTTVTVSPGGKKRYFFYGHPVTFGFLGKCHMLFCGLVGI